MDIQQPRTPAPRGGGSQSDAMSRAENTGSQGEGVQRDERNRSVLEAFEQIAADTAAMKVRKNLIWFAMGNPDLTDPNHSHELPDYTGDLYRAYADLMAAQVSVYPVDVSAAIRFGLRQSANAQLSEDAIAQATGGIAYYNNTDMVQGVLKAVENGSNYYSIAYVPPSTKYDGRKHDIEVKVNRPGIHLTFRNSYYSVDTTKFAMKPGLTMTMVAPPAPKGNMKAPMSRGLPVSSALLFDVGIEPSTASRKPTDPPILGTLDPKLKGKRLVRYGFQYVVPLEQVKFSPDKGGHKGSLDFDIAVYDANDHLLTGLSQTLTMPMSEATYQDALAKHAPVRFYQQIDLPVEQLFVRVGVLDPATEKYGTLELPLHVGRNGTLASAPPPAKTADE
jgi:hypothetical protein